MKKSWLIILLLCIASAIQAQTPVIPTVPKFFNYQGVARKSTGELLASQTLKVYAKIMVLATPGFPTLLTLYVEKRTVTTNAVGMFSIQVGSPGADSTGSTFFFPIASYYLSAYTGAFMHVDVVMPGTNALVSAGDMKLASVPYAFYAEKAGRWDFDAEGSGQNTIYVPSNNNYTVQDSNNYRLLLGTQVASPERLTITGKLRMEDGNQGIGKILTSDASGVSTWQAPPPQGPFKRGSVNPLFGFVFPNAVYPGEPITDSVGIGTITPKADLHVKGKFLLDDGTQGEGYLLTTENNTGVRVSWEKPDWINTAAAGKNYATLYDTTQSVGIGTTTPDSKLHVNGSLRFTGNGGTAVAGNILSVNSSGNAIWKPLPDVSVGGLWERGKKGVDSVVQTQPALAGQDYYSNSKFIINKNIPPVPNVDTKNNPRFYPLQIQGGSSHGLAISINGGIQNITDHNSKFMSFFDANGRRGSIEGQSILDLETDPAFIKLTTVSTLGSVAFGTEIAACVLQADYYEVAVLSVQTSTWIADLLAKIVLLEDNVGVAYASGGADYAEWLERANPSEKLYWGDIVYVAGGKISKSYLPGSQMMVVSKAPMVLGNMPDKDREFLYEKVAFKGQVPVKVTGAVAIGDYIIASGKGDGFGYAVHPKNITADETARMVGVAWSVSGNSRFSTINTAIGTLANASFNTLQKQDEDVVRMQKQMDYLSAYLQKKDPAYQYAKLSTADVPVSKSLFTFPATALQSNTDQVNNPFVEFAHNFKNLTPEQRLKNIDKVNTDKLKKLIYEQPQYLDATLQFLKEKLEIVATPGQLKPEVMRLLNDRALMIETIKKIYGI